MNVSCPVSIGELLDKLSILKIKLKNINDSDKITHIKREEGELKKILCALELKDADKFLDELIMVNSKLWAIEDKIREKEADKIFDQGFIELARSVYLSNDSRFEIKQHINEFYGSELVEVKSYKKY